MILIIHMDCENPNTLDDYYYLSHIYIYTYVYIYIHIYVYIYIHHPYHQFIPFDCHYSLLDDHDYSSRSLLMDHINGLFHKS